MNEKEYQLATNNIKYDSEGRAVISPDDEWRTEEEWDELYKELQKGTSL